MITAASTHKELAQAFLEYMVEAANTKTRHRRHALHASQSRHRRNS